MLPTAWPGQLSKFLSRLQVIPMSADGHLQEAFNIRIDEQRVIDICFLHACALPTVAILFRDNRDNRHVKTYEINVKDKVGSASECLKVHKCKRNMLCSSLLVHLQRRFQDALVSRGLPGTGRQLGHTMYKVILPAECCRALPCTAGHSMPAEMLDLVTCCLCLKESHEGCCMEPSLACLWVNLLIPYVSVCVMYRKTLEPAALKPNTSLPTSCHLHLLWESQGNSSIRKKLDPCI